MLLSQVRRADGGVQTVMREGAETFEVAGGGSLYDIAADCIAAGRGLRDGIAALGRGAAVDLERMAAEGRLLPPLLHPDPAHLHLTGTGLTHLGSAATRDAMHAQAGGTRTADETDSMKMFRLGVEGGRPDGEGAGVQPEWFYKGNGTVLAAPGAALPMPGFAEDGGEEHYAIEIGQPDRARPVLARLHSACFTGDLMGSLKCDCGPQLRGALAEALQVEAVLEHDGHREERGAQVAVGVALAEHDAVGRLPEAQPALGHRAVHVHPNVDRAVVAHARGGLPIGSVVLAEQTLGEEDLRRGAGATSRSLRKRRRICSGTCLRTSA